MAVSKPTCNLGEGEEFAAFISYHHKQEKIADALEKKFLDNGLKVYNYTSGEDFGNQIHLNIVNTIRKSHKVVILMSKEFKESPYFVFEYIEGLKKQSRTKLLALVPVLIDVDVKDLPSLVAQRKAIPYEDTDEFYNHVIQAVCTDIPTDSVLPAGDVGTGLAWSFFYGYLKLKLPTFQSQQLKKACKTEAYKSKQGIKLFRKLIILVPKSCICPSALDKYPGISVLTTVDYATDRGGIVKRDYKSIMLCLQPPQEKEMYAVAAEFATPILSMYDMYIASLITKEELENQRQVFMVKLTEILMNDPDCCDKVTVVAYEDSKDYRNVEKPNLTDFIYQQIKADEASDLMATMTIQDNGPQSQDEPMQS